MKGTDVSESDIKNAVVFLETISGMKWKNDEVKCSITRSQLIRIVAWYGAIRAKSKEPGELFDVTTGEPLGRGNSSAPPTPE